MRYFYHIVKCPLSIRELVESKVVTLRRLLHIREIFGKILNYITLVYCTVSDTLYVTDVGVNTFHTENFIYNKNCYTDDTFTVYVMDLVYSLGALNCNM